MIERLLEGAENVIARPARPMGRVNATASQSDWTFCFLADSRSEKVRDIQSAARVRLIFQHEQDAFVSLAGGAKVIADTAVIARRWLPSYDRIFPTASDRANAAFRRTGEIANGQRKE